jgi:ABC-type multidrug transport system ATPase subunit
MSGGALIGVGPVIAAEGLTREVRGRRILDGVSLAVRAGELVAIIGASGAGKTTLLDALAGTRPAAGGTVRRGPGAVGYVPQDDIIHLQLPLIRTLRYAARLRLPAGTDPAAARARVDEVLALLGLSGRADVPVGSLSGGERKRASIAVELLARPRALFLDEPTSGLDPATAADLLGQLRRLADDGVPVVLTTHNPADVDLCDTVVVLAAGGQLAFTGTPERAREHFGVGSVPQIYARLAAPPPWRTEPVEPSAGAGAGGAAVDGAARLGAFRQGVVLTERGLDILRRNRLTLAILAGSPLVILAMFLMLFRPGAFDFAHPAPGTSVMVLFWIAFGVFFFGLTYGLLQICTELPILRREAFAGVRIVPYLASKVLVLLPLLALVDLLLLAVLRVLDRLPASGFAAVYGTALLASAAALALGLLCSAAVSDVAQASLLLPMLCFPQVLFVGAILPVPAMAAVGRWLSYAMSNRWAFEALGHSTGVEHLWRDGGSPLGPPLLATYGDSFSRAAWVDWVLLAGFGGVFLLAAWLVLSRKVRR